MNQYLIILAGGTGTRMNSHIPKQFLPLNGKPVIVRTIERFLKWKNTIQIIVAANDEYRTMWEKTKSIHFPNLEIQTVNGGTERFHSVKNALACIKEEGLVALHDAARPLVKTQVINECFKMAKANGAAVPVVSMQESLRKVDGEESIHVNRAEFRVVQTPQVFEVSRLKEAYKQEYQKVFTDDASVYESIGGKIHLVEGNRENIKITEPLDLIIAEALV
jgi:2-C-methyl-D-erythritol 4-phosphate cytidylyltransferase